MKCNRGAGTARFVASLVLIAIGLAARPASAAEGGDEENPGWTGTLAISANSQTGTTDSFSGSLDAETERVFNERDEVKARFNVTYGVSRDGTDNPSSTDVTANSQTLTGGHKRTFSETYYWGSNLSAARDTTQNLEVRATFDTGPGVRLWHRKPADKKHFDIGFGPGYRLEIFDGNTGGTVDENGDIDNFIDLVASFEYKNRLFGDRVDFTHTGSFRIPMNDFAAYLIRTEVIFGLPITEAWSFRTAFLLEYTAQPGSDDVLNKTVTRTTVGLEYKF
jgi:hypothetical protein